ncbi:DUF2789 domain-containing protein [Bowmanella sp. JS7-9]|uniref:DUF2789 domain-containing protein n=1 Tax=Pseudobowmanella zhangzhouensis TaxID=1537679 RepID=A0ABW1XHA0_9ALTE|nr:DUF2789 domain-containing protein [Bowmanella sp. JS7-9]TBX25646.1 hypothetical protein TK45_02800 [Bowmanella sp. JS7-9]
MDLSKPTLKGLFSQLGLAYDDAEIDNFIDNHRGLNPDMYLEDAPFWNDSQRKFLRDALREDADWTSAIDQLNARLR